MIKVILPTMVEICLVLRVESTFYWWEDRWWVWFGRHFWGLGKRFEWFDSQVKNFCGSAALVYVSVKDDQWSEMKGILWPNH